MMAWKDQRNTQAKKALEKKGSHFSFVYSLISALVGFSRNDNNIGGEECVLIVERDHLFALFRSLFALRLNFANHTDFGRTFVLIGSFERYKW